MEIHLAGLQMKFWMMQRLSFLLSTLGVSSLDYEWSLVWLDLNFSLQNYFRVIERGLSLIAGT
jgi:hypothetical protein